MQVVVKPVKVTQVEEKPVEVKLVEVDLQQEVEGWASLEVVTQEEEGEVRVVERVVVREAVG